MPLIPDNQGIVRKLLVATPGYREKRVTPQVLKEYLGNLPAVLPAGAEIYWLFEVSGKPKQTLPLQPFLLEGKKVFPIAVPLLQNAGGRFRWVQDPFVCREQDDQRELVISTRAAYPSKEAAIQLASTTGHLVRPVGLRFEGGNLMMLGDYLLAGMDIAFANGIPHEHTWLKQDQTAWETLEAKLHHAFGTQNIIWVGCRNQIQLPLTCVARARNTWQPFFHLDLFMLPAGTNIQGHPRIFLGEPHYLEYDTQNSHHAECIDKLSAGLEEIRQNLLAKIPNLDIQRMPLLTSLSDQRLHVLSLCNGWMDFSAGPRTAYLPDFMGMIGAPRHQEILSQAMRTAQDRLNAWDIQPAWIDMDFVELAQEGGALHCAVKILEKTF